MKTKAISTGSVIATSAPSKAGPNMPIAELAPTIRLANSAATNTAMMVRTANPLESAGSAPLLAVKTTTSRSTIASRYTIVSAIAAPTPRPASRRRLTCSAYQIQASAICTSTNGITFACRVTCELSSNWDRKPTP